MVNEDDSAPRPLRTLHVVQVVHHRFPAARCAMRDAKAAADRPPLKAAGSGANVLLVEPHDPALRRDGIRTAAPCVIAADLLSSAGPGPVEGAEMIGWMQANEAQWRLSAAAAASAGSNAQVDRGQQRCVGRPCRNSMRVAPRLRRRRPSAPRNPFSPRSPSRRFDPHTLPLARPRGLFNRMQAPSDRRLAPTPLLPPRARPPGRSVAILLAARTRRTPSRVVRVAGCRGSGGATRWSLE